MNKSKERFNEQMAMIVVDKRLWELNNIATVAF